MYPFFGRICEKCKNVEAPEHLHTEQLTNEMLCCFVESCSRFYHAVCVGIRYKFAYKCAFNNAWRCAECLEGKKISICF